MRQTPFLFWIRPNKKNWARRWCRHYDHKMCAVWILFVASGNFGCKEKFVFVEKKIIFVENIRIIYYKKKVATNAAPNKKLLRSLSHLMPIVLADEYGTSKHSCCCLSETDEMKTPSYRKVGKRATVVKCKQCKTMLSRDFNASVNIVEAFIFLNATRRHSNQFRPAERNMQTEARGTTN